MLGFLYRPRFWAISGLVALIAAGVALSVPHLWAWYHLRAAREELRRYHNPQAIVHLKACLQVWPNDAEVCLLVARSARRARVYNDAEHYLEKYQQLKGCDDALTFEQLLLSAERNVDSVEELCWHYVEQDHPEKSLIMEALARGYLRQYQLPKARLCLEHWLEIEPDNVQALCLDGQLHLDYEKARAAAVESYRRAVQVDPESEDARLGLTAALLESKLYTEAVEQLDHLLQRHPNNLRVRLELAQCRSKMGDAAEALRLVEHVLAQQSDYAPALALRGRLALDSGQSEEAESWLRQAIARNPNDHDARVNLIRCLRQNDKEEEAEQQQRHLDQREADVKRFNEIITRELPQRPRDPALHCDLGKLLLRGGHREEGLRWLQSALRLDAGYAPARQALAEHFGKSASQ
jgi:tetratricopeptide (TPR) repeat protein